MCTQLYYVFFSSSDFSFVSKMLWMTLYSTLIQIGTYTLTEASTNTTFFLLLQYKTREMIYYYFTS